MDPNAKRNAEIVARRLRGERPRALARAMGISPNIVAGVLYRHGMTIETSRSDNRRKGLIPRETRVAAVIASLEHGRGVAVARELGIRPDTLSKWKALWFRNEL